MPIYEFHCERCARDSELLVRSGHGRGATCPHCGSRRLRKLFSTFASHGTTKRVGASACGSCSSSSCSCCGSGGKRAR